MNRLQEIAHQRAAKNKKKLEDERIKVQATQNKTDEIDKNEQKDYSGPSHRSSSSRLHRDQAKESAKKIDLVAGAAIKDWGADQAGAINSWQVDKDKGATGAPGSGRRHGYKKPEKEVISKIQQEHAKQAQDTIAWQNKVKLESQAKLAEAKKGMSPLGQWGVDVGYGAVQLGLDIGAGALLGGGQGAFFTAMGNRAYGAGYNQAKQEGAKDFNAQMFGLANAGKEILTEKLFGVGKTIKGVMGTGLVDAEKLLKKGVFDTIKSESGREVAQAMTKFGLTAGTEGAEEFLAGMVEPVLRKYIYSGEELDLGEMLKQSLYDASIGAALGSGFGAVDVAADMTAGKFMKENEATQQLIESGLASKENSKAYRLAQSMATRKAAGIDPTSQDIAMLRRANSQAIQEEEKEEIRTKQQTDRAIAKSIGPEYVDNSDIHEQFLDTESRAESGEKIDAPVAVKEYKRTIETVMDAMAPKLQDGEGNILVEDGNREDVVSISKILVGRASSSDFERLYPSNPIARTVFEELTGSKLPETNAQTRKALLEFSENKRVVMAKMTKDPTTVMAREDAVNAYRRAGEMGLAKEKVSAKYGTVLSEAEINMAYNSGIQHNEAKQKVKGPVTQETKKNRSTGLTKSDFGFADMRVAKEKYEQSKELDKIGKLLGMRIELVDKIEGEVNGKTVTANGSYKDGVLKISAASGQPMAVILSHELWHHLKQVNKNAAALENFVKKEMFSNDPAKFNAEMEKYMQKYGTRDEDFVMEEIMADSLHEILGSKELWDKLTAENKTLADKIIAFLKEFVESLKAVFQGETESQIYDRLGIKEEVVTQLAEIIRGTKGSVAVKTKNELYSVTDEQLQMDFEMTPEGAQMTIDALKDLSNVEVVKVEKKDPKNKYGGKDLGMAFDYKLIQAGDASILGHKVTSEQDLATVAQIFRDPRFETFRYFFLDKDGTIVFQTGVKTGLPSSTVLSDTNDIRDYLARVCAAAKQRGASSMYVMHNHPAGTPKPSDNDILSTSSMIPNVEANGIEFIGHIIINHKQYAFMPKDEIVNHKIYHPALGYNKKQVKAYQGKVQTMKLPGAGKDPLLSASIPHSMLMSQLKSTDDIVAAAKALQRDPDQSVVIWGNAHLEIIGIQEYPNSFFQRKDRDKILREQMLAFGSTFPMMVTNDPATFGEMMEMTRKKYILEAVYISTDTGKATSAIGMTGVKSMPPIDKAFGKKGKPERVGPDTKFSLADPVETKGGLIAVHNLEAGALKEALNLGGLPMPSIAIVTPEVGHNDFGPISVILGKSSIDPKNSNNKVFDADAWTPTFPAVGYKYDQEKINKAIRKAIDLNGGEDNFNLKSYMYDGNIPESRGATSIFDGIQGNHGIKAAFLAENNIPYKKTKREVKYEHDKKLMDRIIDKYGMQQIQEWSQARVNEIDQSVYDNIAEIMNDYYSDGIGKRVKLYTEDNFGFGKFDQLMQSIVKYHKDWNAEIVDIFETGININAALKGHEAEYEEWGNKLFEGTIIKKGIKKPNVDWFTPSGNRKSFEGLYMEYTLDNIVKAMRAENTQGAFDTYGAHAGAVKGVLAKQFKSVSEIKKDSRKIADSKTSHAEYDRITNMLHDFSMKLVDEYIKAHPNENQFMIMDNGASAIMDAARTSGTPAAIKRAFDEYSEISYTDKMVQDLANIFQEIRDLPVQLFEAKPRRAVGLDEIQLVVLPKDTDKKLVSDLKDRGIKVDFYDKDKEGDRIAKVNSHPEVRWSLMDTDSEGNKLTPEQIEFFKDSMVRDEQGRLLRLYHQTNVKTGFTVFYPLSHFGDKTVRDNIDHDLQALSAERGSVYPVYLNITNLVRTEDVGGDWTNMDEYTRDEVPEANGLVYLNRFEGVKNRETGEWASGNDTYEDYYFDPMSVSDEDFLKKFDAQDSYIAFDPNQVKSVFNKKPTSANDIRFSLEDSEGNKLSKEQIEFFKDSQVRDKLGRLLKVYHGTGLDFTAFDIHRSGENFDRASGGIYFTDDYDSANIYAEIGADEEGRDDSGIIINAYLNIKNPLTLTAPTGTDSIVHFDDNAWDIMRNAKGNGHDGVIVYGESRNLYIAFYPEQIKSVDNKKPTSANDIRYSLGDQLQDDVIPKGLRHTTKELKAIVREHADQKLSQRDFYIADIEIFEQKMIDKEGVVRKMPYVVVLYGGNVLDRIVEEAIIGRDKLEVDGAPVFVTAHRKEDVDNARAQNEKRDQELAQKKKEKMSRKSSTTNEIDSEGNKLTPEQIEFFKDSQVRDADGNLQVAYHGTNKGGFTVFSETDDIGYFFGSSIDVAGTYTNAENEIDIPKPFDSWKELFEYLDVDPTARLTEEGTYWIGSRRFKKSQLADATDYVLKSLMGAEFSTGIYKVYLNLKDPLIVDAKGSNWNNLLVDDFVAYTHSNVQIGLIDGVYKFSYDVTNNFAPVGSDKGRTWHEDHSFEDSDELEQFLENEFFEYEEDAADFYDFFTQTVEDSPGKMFPQSDIHLDSNGSYAEMLNTRDVVERAADEGYDGVIFKNIVDHGGRGKGSGKGDVYVAFDSNQIKLTSNLKPTDHDDIRYSLEDSEGNELTPEQLNYFADSQVRDENGRLKVLYHGTDNGGFMTFKQGENDYGQPGFWFSDSWVATTYFDGPGTIFNTAKDAEPEAGEGLYKVYLYMENPMTVEGKGSNWNNIQYDTSTSFTFEDLQVFSESGMPISGKGGPFEVSYYLHDLTTGDKTSVSESFDSYAEFTKYLIEQGVDKNAALDLVGKVANELRGFNMTILGDINFAEDGKKVAGYSMTTRDLVATALNNGHDGVIFRDIDDHGGKGYGSSRGDVYVVFDSNQIKAVDNLSPTDHDDIRFSIDGTASYTPERLDGFFEMFGSEHHMDYAKGYVAYISPADFLDLTASKTKQKAIKRRTEAIMPDGIDEDELAGEDAIFLDVDLSTGRVDGHEGRHRMTALMNRGIKSVPVLIRTWGEKGKYSRQKLESLTLKGQYLDRYESGGIKYAPGRVKIGPVYPLSTRYKDEVYKTFTDPAEIRYSLESEADAERAFIKKKIEELQASLAEEKLAEKGMLPNKDALNKLQHQLRKAYNSDIKPSELTKELTEIFGLIKAGKRINNVDKIADRAYELAMDIVSQGGVLNNETAKEYKALKEYMRKTPLKIMDEHKGDFGQGDWNRFRKSQFGRLNITDSGQTMDSIYVEMLELFPELLDKEITHPSDQLKHVMDVIDTLEPTFEKYNTNTAEGSEMVAMAMGDILDSMYEMEPEKALSPGARRNKYKAILDKIDKATDEYANKTKAERKADKEQYQRMISELEAEEATKRIEMKKRYDQLAEQLKKERDEYVAMLKLKGDKRVSKEAELWRSRLERTKERAKERQGRKKTMDSIKTNSAWLAEALIRPSDKKHIPEGYRQAVAQVLIGIDFESTRSDSWEKKYGRPSRRVMNLRALAEQYNNISAKQDFSFMEIDDNMKDLIQTMANTIDGKRLSELDDNQLNNVRILLMHLRHTISMVNRAFNESIKEDISELGESAISEMSKDKVKRERAGTIGAISKYFNEQAVTPADFFAIAGGTVERMYYEIRKGFDQHINNVTQAMEYIDKAMQGVDVKDVREWSEKHGTPANFKLKNGQEITMLPSQVMSLYAMMKRKQAQGHVLGSGIVIAPLEAKTEKAFGKQLLQAAHVMLTYEDVQMIIKSMSDEQIKLTNRLLHFITTTTSEWGNQTSMKLYGYRKFTEENYFPIKSADVFLDSQFDKGDAVTKIKNMGFTKNTVVNANNPIVVDDFFNVITDHITKMSMYNALVPALTDFERVYNYKQKNGSVQTNSVQNAIVMSMGSKGKSYIDQLLRDINGSSRREFGNTIPEKALAGFKKAALGLNLRVLVQQPTSMLRAALLIDMPYLIQGMGEKVAGEATRKEMWEHVPIARWKSWGYAQTDVSREQRDIMLGVDNKMDAVTMGMYGFADDISWTVLYAAVKAETKDKHPELKFDTPEYWEHIVKRFNEIVDRTQVVDSVFHRADIMRDKTFFKKMITSFMPEPLKLYNMARTQYHLIVKLQRDGKTDEAAKAAVRLVATLTPYFAVLTAVQAVMDTIRRSWTGGDDDDDKNYWELFKINFGDNLVDNLNPMTMLPILRDVWSIWQGFDVKRPDLAATEKLIEDLNMTIKYFKEDGAVSQSPVYIARRWAEDLAMFKGIPLKNALREIESFTYLGYSLAGYPQYSIYLKNKLRYNIAESKSTFIDLYLKAEVSGSAADAKLIYDDMKKNGIRADDIMDRIKSVYGKDLKAALDSNDIKGATASIDKMIAAGAKPDEIAKSVRSRVSEVYKVAFAAGDTAAMKGYDEVLRAVNFTEADIANYKYGYARGYGKYMVYKAYMSGGISAAYAEASKWIGQYPGLYDSVRSMVYYTLEASAESTMKDWDDGKWRKSDYDKFE